MPMLVVARGLFPNCLALIWKRAVVVWWTKRGGQQIGRDITLA